MKLATLGVKFALELGAFTAFAYWGATLTSGAAAIILAIAAPTAAIVLWQRPCAPKAPRRLPMRFRIPVELGVFGLAALALATAGEPALAAVYAVCAAVNAMFLTRFEQSEA